MTQKPAPNPRAGFSFIIVTVMLDMLAVGIIIPVLPKLILSLTGGAASDASAISQASMVAGVLGVAWALMQFLGAPLLGGLSDRFGRRPIVLFSNFGLAVSYVLAALSPNLAWLLLARIISGISAASQSTANAYIADVTAPEHRAQGFAMLGAAFGLGFILGPALGGIVAFRFGSDAPFWLAAAFSLANGLYGLFILPESLPKDRRTPFRLRQSNPLAALRFLTSRPDLAGLSLAYFFNFLAHVALPSTFVLYASYRYQWNVEQVGATLAVVGVASMITQLFLVKPLVARLGERAAILLGLGCGAMAFLLYGLAPTGAWFFVGLAFGALWGVYTPANQALLTSRVSPEEQGRLQGALGASASVGGLIGPLLFTQVFALFVRDGPIQIPGAAFFLASALLACALLIARRAMAREVPGAASLLAASADLASTAADSDAPATTR